MRVRDPIDRLSSSGGGRVAIRAARTAAVLSAHGARALARRTRGEDWGRAAAVELRVAFEKLGPTYVKLAQLVASSPGLFPDVLAEEFRSCLDDVAPIEWDLVERIVEEELGEAVADLFSRFDREPMAAASIGQVHGAALPDGTEVVVKVQRPGIRARLESDMRLLRRIARILEARSERWRMASPIAVVQEFAENLNDELNFIVGARASERFADNLRESGRANVRTPAVYWRWTSPRVLTMERVAGCDLNELDALRARGVDLEATLRTIVAVCLESVLEHGFFHGDIHPGNLMVDEGGTVVLLDFGITGVLDERTREILRSGLPALLVTRDYGAIARMIGDLGSGIAPDDLARAAVDIEAVLAPLLGASLADISYGDLLMKLVEVGTRYRAQLPRALVLVAKQFLYIERYAKAMAPDWSMLSDPAVLSQLAGVKAS